MTTRLIAEIAFGGGLGDPEYTHRIDRDCELDPDLAAADLRRAGYEVHRFPDEHRARLDHPLDDFIEAVIEGPNDPKVIHAIMNEVSAICDKYGGLCCACGPIEPHYVPFAALLKQDDSDRSGRVA